MGLAASTRSLDKWPEKPALCAVPAVRRAPKRMSRLGGLAVQAARSEPVSASPEFPVHQGKYREFSYFRPQVPLTWFAQRPRIRRVLVSIPYRTEQGNFPGEQRKPSPEQGPEAGFVRSMTQTHPVGIEVAQHQRGRGIAAFVRLESQGCWLRRPCRDCGPGADRHAAC
jgi:hypothetical protein